MTIELDKRRNELHVLNVKAWEGDFTYETVSKLEEEFYIDKKVKSISNESSLSILKRYSNIIY